MPDKPRLSRCCRRRRRRGAKLTRGSCRRHPMGSSWFECSGTGTRCAPPEGACETSAPSAPSTASRRWRRRGRARGCRRCSSRRLVFRVHGGWGGNTAVVCVPIAVLSPSFRWPDFSRPPPCAQLAVPRMLGRHSAISQPGDLPASTTDSATSVRGNTIGTAR